MRLLPSWGIGVRGPYEVIAISEVLGVKGPFEVTAFLGYWSERHL